MIAAHQRGGVSKRWRAIRLVESRSQRANVPRAEDLSSSARCGRLRGSSSSDPQDRSRQSRGRGSDWNQLARSARLPLDALSGGCSGGEEAGSVRRQGGSGMTTAQHSTLSAASTQQATLQTDRAEKCKESAERRLCTPHAGAIPQALPLAHSAVPWCTALRHAHTPP